VSKQNRITKQLDNLREKSANLQPTIDKLEAENGNLKTQLELASKKIAHMVKTMQDAIRVANAYDVVTVNGRIDMLVKEPDEYNRDEAYDIVHGIRKH
jgi:chromosome segregation ATPase